MNRYNLLLLAEQGNFDTRFFFTETKIGAEILVGFAPTEQGEYFSFLFATDILLLTEQRSAVVFEAQSTPLYLYDEYPMALPTLQ